jgi:N utilization substance protein A
MQADSRPEGWVLRTYLHRQEPMSDFEDIFAGLRSERGVNRDSVISAIEASLLAAYTASADAKSAAYARAIFDPATGSMQIERLIDLHSGDLPRPGIDVVDGPNGREIAVVNWDELPDEERETIELDSERFGRVAATAAKDALRREVRGSAQQLVYDRYQGKIGELVEGVVGERIADGMLVQLADAQAIIPFDDRLPGQQPRSGERIAAIVTAVSERSDWAQVTLSQSDTRFVEAIFASEIKEVREGKIQLRIARIPGVRSKVAVSNSSDERGAVSPIGICVGERGSRIRLMRDMLGEEIDLLAFEPDPVTFVHAALHPAKIRRVEQVDGGYVAIVSEDEQANIAGADGQGLKLASMLVGAPITMQVEDAAAVADRASELVAGACQYIRPNGRQCVNAAEPGSRFCSLPGHQPA